MRARIVRVGNSRGIRLPKAGLQEEVEIHAEPGRIIIESARRPRSGWAEAARLMTLHGEDDLLDEPSPTEFDSEEWTW
jgi:antitoxin MazE